MPVVPFTDPSAATRSKASASLPPTPPAEPFALMAMAQMHSEGRLAQPDETSKVPDERAG